MKSAVHLQPGGVHQWVPQGFPRDAGYEVLRPAWANQHTSGAKAIEDKVVRSRGHRPNGRLAVFAHRPESSLVVKDVELGHPGVDFFEAVHQYVPGFGGGVKVRALPFVAGPKAPDIKVYGQRPFAEIVNEVGRNGRTSGLDGEDFSSVGTDIEWSKADVMSGSCAATVDKNVPRVEGGFGGPGFDGKSVFGMESGPPTIEQEGNVDPPAAVDATDSGSVLCSFDR